MHTCSSGYIYLGDGSTTDILLFFCTLTRFKSVKTAFQSCSEIVLTRLFQCNSLLNSTSNSCRSLFFISVVVNVIILEQSLQWKIVFWRRLTFGNLKAEPWFFSHVLYRTCKSCNRRGLDGVFKNLKKKISVQK